MTSLHPAIQAGRVAVICGSSSGIGLALAKAYASRGMHVVLGDINSERLARAAGEVQAAAKQGARIAHHTVDVTDRASVEGLRSAVRADFKDAPIGVLHANAGVGGPTKASSTDGWDRILNTNFHGVVNVCTIFVPDIQAQFADGGLLAGDADARALVVATGSKQGITTPPGSGAAYNISKAAVKVYTESLAHELRQDKGSRIDVKLLVPGWVWTALTGAESGKPKPDGAWTPEQTVEYFLQKAAKGSFYIICPDTETSEQHDLARMEWSMQDLLQDRPPLSRWHEEHTPKYEAFMKSKGL